MGHSEITDSVNISIKNFLQMHPLFNWQRGAEEVCMSPGWSCILLLETKDRTLLSEHHLLSSSVLHQSKHSGHKGGCCTSEVCVSQNGLLTERTNANAQGLIYRKVIKPKETSYFLCP